MATKLKFTVSAELLLNDGSKSTVELERKVTIYTLESILHWYTNNFPPDKIYYHTRKKPLVLPATANLLNYRGLMSDTKTSVVDQHLIIERA